MAVTENNRNLSDVIHSITDEGPSSSSAQESGAYESMQHAPADVEQPRRSWTRLVIACLLAGLLVAAIFLLATGGGRESSRTAAVSSAVPVDARTFTDPRTQKIMQRQDLLDSQIKQLASVVAESNAILLKLLEQQDASAARRESILGGVTSVQGAQADAANAGQSAAVAGSESAQEVEPAPEPALAPESVAVAAVKPPPLTIEAPASVENMPSPKTIAADTQRADDANVAAVALSQPPAAPQTRPQPVVPVVAPGTVAAGDQSWVINVAFFERQAPVAALMERFTAAGIATEQQPVRVNGVDGYRLRVTGFSGYAEARDFMNNSLDNSLGIKGAWVSRYE